MIKKNLLDKKNIPDYLFPTANNKGNARHRECFLQTLE